MPLGLPQRLHFQPSPLRVEGVRLSPLANHDQSIARTVPEHVESREGLPDLPRVGSEPQSLERIPVGFPEATAVEVPVGADHPGPGTSAIEFDGVLGRFERLPVPVGIDEREGLRDPERRGLRLGLDGFGGDLQAPVRLRRLHELEPRVDVGPLTHGDPQLVEGAACLCVATQEAPEPRRASTEAHGVQPGLPEGRQVLELALMVPERSPGRLAPQEGALWAQDAGGSPPGLGRVG